MVLEATPVFEFMYDAYTTFRDKVDKIGFILEGSSGSSKTVSTIQFLMFYSQLTNNERITCGRSKMTWTIPSIWEDTLKFLNIYNQPIKVNNTKYRLYHNANSWSFVGADDPQKFHGPRQEVFWFNEAMELSKSSFDQVDMRTNKLWILDYNPSFVKHWIYELTSGMEKWGIGEMKIVHKEVDGRIIKVAYFFLRSTFRMNKMLPPGQLQKILSYEPTIENIANGTADERLWRIYGCGLRAQPRGLVFPDYNEWDGILPDNINDYKHFLGFDPGGNDPNAISETWISRKYRKIYSREILYKSDVSTNDIINIVKPYKLPVICDSARRDKILDLEIAGIMAIGAHKIKVIPGIDMMHQYGIYITGTNYINEFSGYRFVVDVKTDKLSEEPIDKDNHLIDQLRYIVVFYHQNYL